VNAALITSPEYSMKKLLGSGLTKIFTITPVFRNHEAVNRTHLPEFMMLEWYGEGGYEDLMQETESLLQYVLEDEEPWERIAYADANVDEHGDPQITSERFFLTYFPAHLASLAKLSKDQKTAERFEAFAADLELCNGFAELTDATEQRKRFEQEARERTALGKQVFPVDEALLQALERIDRPIYGNALGIDRLLMLKYGIKDIRDIQLIETLT
jgi:lysyl-tRNA synthetase class 2